MSYVHRMNSSIAGLGCSNCGGEDDCFGASQTSGFQAAAGVAAAEGSAPLGHPYSQYHAAWPKTGLQIPAGIMPPAGLPTANEQMSWASGGYPGSMRNPDPANASTNQP